MANKVILMGNVTRDVETTFTASGTAIAKFGLATNKKVKGEERTEFHNIVTFGKVAEILNEHLSKGDPLYVEGEIHYDSWDGDNGKKNYRTEIQVWEFEFVRGGDRAKAPARPTAAAPATAVEEEDDGLPF